MIKSNVGISIILVIIIAVTATIGTVLLVNNQNKTEGYVKTKAVVVNYKEKTEYDSDYGYQTMYSEIVEYEVDGRKYRSSNSVWTNSPKGIGKEIEVAYNPDDPSQCVFVKSQNFASVVLYLMSAICLLALIAHIVTSKKTKNRQSGGRNNGKRGGNNIGNYGGNDIDFNNDDDDETILNENEKYDSF